MGILSRFFHEVSLIIKKLCTQYSGVRLIFNRYWASYGGWRALVSSPYLHVAIVLSALMYQQWWRADWWQTPLDILPDLLGFSLGGYAVLLTFGNEQFQKLLMGPGESGKSPYADINGAFVHFLLVQFGATLLALVGRSVEAGIGSHWVGQAYAGFAYLAFIYALATGVAAVMTVFRVATLYDRVLSAPKSSQNSSNTHKDPD